MAEKRASLVPLRLHIRGGRVMTNHLDIGAIHDVLSDVIELLEVVRNDVLIMKREIDNGEL